MTSKEELQAIFDLRVYLARIQYYMQQPQLEFFLKILGLLFNAPATDVMMTSPNEIVVMINKKDYTTITEAGEELFIPTLYDRAAEAAYQLFKYDSSFMNVCNECGHMDLFDTIKSHQAKYLGALFQIIVANPSDHGDATKDKIQIILVV